MVAADERTFGETMSPARRARPCARTEAPADLALGVAELGAAYLGDPVLARLARVGRVEELRPGALAVAALAFAHDPLPWCPGTL